MFITPHKGDDVLAERCRRRFRPFFETMWPVMEGRLKLEWTWHLDLILHELEQVAWGRNNRLVICQPPGTVKSMSLNLWFSWLLYRDASDRWLFSGKTPKLVHRDAMRARRVVQSRVFRRLLRARGLDWGLSREQNSKEWWETTEGGFRMSIPIGGAVIGQRPRGLVFDDPLDVKQTMGPAAKVSERMAEINERIDTAFVNRLEDQRTGPIVICMQRLHVDDPAGVKIREGWRVLNLSMEFDPKHEHNHPKDPRNPGESLDPARFPPSVLEVHKRNKRYWQTQYQQAPVPTEGGLFDPENWVLLPAAQFPADFDRIVQAWDLTFEGTSSSAYTVGVCLGQVGARYYVLDVRRGQWDYVQQKREVVRLQKDWQSRSQGVIKVVVEKAANASALLRDLQSVVPGLDKRKATDHKVVRAQAWSPVQEARQITLPRDAPWTDELIYEHGAFPHGSYKDQVDALGHGILWTIEHPLAERHLAIDHEGLTQPSAWAL